MGMGAGGAALKNQGQGGQELLRIQCQLLWSPYGFCDSVNPKKIGAIIPVILCNCQPPMASWIFLMENTHQPAWCPPAQSLLLLPSHSRWIEQFSRETKRYHFAFFITQFVSDNPLVISNFPPFCQQRQGSLSLHGCQACSRPACCRINMSCPPHHGDLRGVRDSSNWNAQGREDQLPASFPIFSTTASSLRSALESAFKLKARRTHVCRTFYTFQSTFSHSQVWSRPWGDDYFSFHRVSCHAAEKNAGTLSVEHPSK